jgi:1-acyl-sn-glycerol-3-phosphate acyltransferase
VTYSSSIQSTWRLVAFIVWALSSTAVQGLLVLVNSRFRHTFPLVVHRGCGWLLNAKAKTSGEPRQNETVPTMFVANHTGYADITVMGTLLRANFVAKAEIKKWPIYGWCARLSNCLFVDRRPRFALKQTEEIRERLRTGNNIIMFPEGTSSDGNRVLSFRSSLFAAADTELDGEQIYVQPVSIAYTELDGLPLGRHLRPLVAWYGDMDIATHLWELIGLGKLGVEVVYHDPVRLKDFESRKALADYCHAVIAAGLSKSLTGHEQPVIFPPEPGRKSKWIPPITPTQTTAPGS